MARKTFRCSTLTALLLTSWFLHSAHAAADEVVSSDMRLSQWLNGKATLQNSGNPYLPGMAWMVPEEAVVQQRRKLRLLDQISSVKTDPALADGLERFVTSMPASGRVVLDKTDPRWLEVNPDEDPYLKRGQRIVIPERPASVTVVKADGSTCQVMHYVRLYALDYARRCGIQPQWVWVVQPDGLIKKSGSAPWNETRQDPPAPGAWIVVSDPAWPDQIPAQVARLLATQGVAIDRSGMLPAPEAPLGRPRDNALTYNDWGMIGLMQTPTARMESAGNAALNVSRVAPYTRLNGSMQIMDWFGLAVRWTSISDVLYGPASFSGSQAYKDKSIDFKFKLSDESRLFPETALGLVDVGGTGLFSSEYIVSSKRTGNFDWSLGLAWGYLGSRGNIGNPLSVFSPSFSVRPAPNVGSGGTLNGSSMFRGQTSLFGGVQYQTPWDQLLLKLEYDGNNYQSEPFIPLKQNSPINVGLVYRYNPAVDLALNFERGNTFGIAFTLHDDLTKLFMPKLNDPTALPVSAAYPEKESDWKEVASLLEKETSWHVLEIRRAGSEVIVRFQDANAVYWKGYLDRIVSVLHRYVPDRNVLVFRIQSSEYGLGMHEFVVDRQTWVDAHTQFMPVQHRQSPLSENPAYDGFEYPREDRLFDGTYKQFTGTMGFYLEHSFGGPEGLLYRLGYGAEGNWNFSEDTWWTGSLQYGLIDNYNKFIYPASNDALPRVRTQVERYVETAPVTMPVFQFTHVGKLDGEDYYSVYGGMLESMFGGVGGEWLYRPWQSPVAFGVDINSVQQRGYRQDFSFIPYRVVTGHASVYWDTGIDDINATLHAGRYLAGDIGVTLDVSRSFSNGVRMGAFATKTNVSAAQFGEGSFDKGIYVDIPFDAMMTRSSTSFASIMYHPLLRDGGAMLDRQFTLYDMTRDQGGNLLKVKPWSDERTTEFGESDDDYDAPKKSVFASAKEDLANTGRLMETPEFWNSMLWIGGITLASSALDRPADRLAVDYGSRPAAKSFESVGNALPYLAIGASGLAFLGGDQELSETGYSSLSAGGIAFLGTMGLKYVIGRERPLYNNGSSRFNFLNLQNGNASMPSGHTTIMWSLVTPYAKAYDAPWLYGLAAVTNLSRIGGRNHWLSDTVAGSLLGYGIGDFMYQSHRTEKRGMQLQVTPFGVSAYWKMD